jgi:hypothetical protein
LGTNRRQNFNRHLHEVNNVSAPEPQRIPSAADPKALSALCELVGKSGSFSARSF